MFVCSNRRVFSNPLNILFCCRGTSDYCSYLLGCHRNRWIWREKNVSELSINKICSSRSNCRALSLDIKKWSGKTQHVNDQSRTQSPLDFWSTTRWPKKNPRTLVNDNFSLECSHHPLQIPTDRRSAGKIIRIEETVCYSDKVLFTLLMLLSHVINIVSLVILLWWSQATQCYNFCVFRAHNDWLALLARVVAASLSDLFFYFIFSPCILSMVPGEANKMKQTKRNKTK